MQNIRSPITNDDDLLLVDIISTEDIIGAYAKQGLDVDSYFKGISEVKIILCQHSGYRFYYPFNIFATEAFYKILNTEKNGYHKIRWEHKKALNFIKREDKVLEIGCGNGLFLERLKEYEISAKGIEINETAVAEANEKGLTVYHQSIAEHGVEFFEAYDVICFFQVLEHISEVKNFIESSLRALRKNGKIIIAVPNNNPYLFRFDRLHALNLPPHHAGLWDIRAFNNLPRFFPIKKLHISAEPLKETKKFWQIQKQHWNNTNPILSLIANNIPHAFDPLLYKAVKKIFPGRNLIAVFEKTTNN